MSNFLSDIFRSEPHPLGNVRIGLEEAIDEKTELIPLMKKHHDYLGESIEVLISPDNTDVEKQAHLYRFFRLVEMHGKAEEEVLYAALRKNPNQEARLAGYAALDEHDVAFQLEKELLEMGYQETWNEQIAAKAKVVACLVKNHIKEEENDIFPLSEDSISEHDFERMQLAYIAKCKTYLDESIKTSIHHPLERSHPTDLGYSSNINF